jgi:hypothetical protein
MPDAQLWILQEKHGVLGLEQPGDMRGVPGLAAEVILRGRGPPPDLFTGSRPGTAGTRLDGVPAWSPGPQVMVA